LDELTVLLVRTVIVYFLLTVSMRIMGKRQLGEMELSDLITTLLFSEIASVPIVDLAIPLFHAVIPILIIISFEIIIPFIIGKNRKVKKLVEGKPSYLIYKGELRLSEIKKNRVSLDELMCELRNQGYFDISDINYAVLEPNGQLSVLPKENDENLRNAGGMMHSIILNGEVVEFNLKLLDIDISWVNKTLASMGARLEEVYLLGIDDQRNLIYAVSKNGKNTKIIKKFK